MNAERSAAWCGSRGVVERVDGQRRAARPSCSLLSTCSGSGKRRSRPSPLPLVDPHCYFLVCASSIRLVPSRLSAQVAVFRQPIPTSSAISLAPDMISALPASPAAMSTFAADGTAGPDSALLNENRFCPGCKKSVIDENGGVVVAFGCVPCPFFPHLLSPFYPASSPSLLPSRECWCRYPCPPPLRSASRPAKLTSSVHQPILLPC